jgi:NitT/TauT family transport system substrate-binding protein
MMTKTLSRYVVVAVLLFAANAASTLPLLAQGTPQTVVFGVTGKSVMSWPEIVSDQMGFFTANGIKVEIIYTGSTVAGAQQLIAGSLDISEVSSTEIIQAVLAGAPIRTIIETSTKPPYVVMAKKGLVSIAQLKGKTIIVGGPDDITRVFMDKILESASLKPNDYTYTFAGATSARFAALLNGGVDAAILFPPFSFHAANQGYTLLADVTKYFPSFLFTTFAVKPSWAQTHRDLVLAYAKGYLQGVRWLYDPRNKARAIQILSQSTNTSAEDAVQAYDLVTKLRVFSETGIPNDRDVTPVLDALAKTGRVKPPMPSASRFYDDSYAKQANSELRTGH